TLAIPGLALEGGPQRGRVRPPASRAIGVALVGEGCEERDGAQQEPAEPHALALAAFADPVHAVIPVAGADERQAVLAGERQALVEATGAMLEERRLLVRDVGHEEGIVLALGQP